MESVCNSIFSLLLLLLLLYLSSFQFLSVAYEIPDKYFINCGSDAPVNFTGRKFTGDKNSGFLSSKDSWDIKASNQLPGTLPPTLYQTARIFWQQSYYEFEITENGTYLVRLHFFAFSSSSSSSDLSTAVFDVSAFPDVSNFGFKLLNNFTAKNSSKSPIIKEFFLGLDPGSFRIFLTPQASSFAFVNAIEVFLAPGNFNPENFNRSVPLVLHTTYRVNVGGQEVTPDKDQIWRTWEQDHRYLSDPNSAKKISYPNKLSYYNAELIDQATHFIAANPFTAPDSVYQTAQEMNITPSRPFNAFNITWSFPVSKNIVRHLIRVHFCDIVGQPGNVVFDLYSTRNFSKKVGGTDSQFSTQPATPFYYDFVVDTDQSELINVSIGARTQSMNNTAFLNGLEMWEILEGPASILNTKTPKNRNVGVVVGSVVVVVSFVCIVGVWFGLKCRKVKRIEILERPGNRPASGGGSTGSPISHPNCRFKIPFSELQRATNNFDTKLVIGAGGFGNVYRGTLSNGRKVAVKRCRKGSAQGLQQFQTEITVLSQIRHRHIVSLVGYCDENYEMILVYEYMERGTLKDHLYGADLPRLPWNKRLQICIGAARGLHYLHTFVAGGIIHRDVKSANILLDENHVAKVADLGISRYGSVDETHVVAAVKGTFGYVDPDYFKSQKLTERSDVYSFGVVLLEVLCARPAIDRELPREQMNLASWGLHCKKEGLLEHIVDSSLKDQIDPSSLRIFSETIEKCLRGDAAYRPTMGNVLWDLEYALQIHQTENHREHNCDDSDTAVNASLAFSQPFVERLPPVTSTVEKDDITLSWDDGSDTTASQAFSQLKFGNDR